MAAAAVAKSRVALSLTAAQLMPFTLQRRAVELWRSSLVAHR
jgi:hypothetical protein